MAEAGRGHPGHMVRPDRPIGTQVARSVATTATPSTVAGTACGRRATRTASSAVQGSSGLSSAGPLSGGPAEHAGAVRYRAVVGSPSRTAHEWRRGRCRPPPPARPLRSQLSDLASGPRVRRRCQGTCPRRDAPLRCPASQLVLAPETAPQGCSSAARPPAAGSALCQRLASPRAAIRTRSWLRCRRGHDPPPERRASRATGPIPRAAALGAVAGRGVSRQIAGRTAAGVRKPPSGRVSCAPGRRERQHVGMPNARPLRETVGFRVMAPEGRSRGAPPPASSTKPGRMPG